MKLESRLNCLEFHVAAHTHIHSAEGVKFQCWRPDVYCSLMSTPPELRVIVYLQELYYSTFRSSWRARAS